MPILNFHHDLPEIAYGDPSFFVARRSGVNSLLTTNRDYARVADLDVYTCNPAALPQRAAS
jgi:hypothetical protein